MNVTYSPAPPRRWYCSFCKRDKQLPVPTTAIGKAVVQVCPDCGNRSCVWLEFTPRIRRGVPSYAPGEQFLKRQPQPEARP